jgi:hypothetical protein
MRSLHSIPLCLSHNKIVNEGMGIACFLEALHILLFKKGLDEVAQSTNNIAKSLLA